MGPATPSPVVGSSQAQSGDNFGSMDEEAARDEAEYEEGGASICKVSGARALHCSASLMGSARLSQMVLGYVRLGAGVLR